MKKSDRNIKPFLQVTVGEEAYHHEDHELIGFIKWKGNTKELKKSQYSNLLVEDIADNSSPEEDEDDLLSDYDWVIIDEPMYGATLYNYNCDPSGVITFSEQTSPAEDTEEFVNLGKYRKDNSIEELLMHQDKKYNKNAYIVRVSNYIDINHLSGIRLDYKLINIPIAIFSNRDDAIKFSKGVELGVDINDFYKVKSVVVVDIKGNTIYSSLLSLELSLSEKTKVYDQN